MFAAALLVAAQTAAAVDTGTVTGKQYWGINLGGVEAEVAGAERFGLSDFEMFSMSALYGYELHPRIALEGRFGRVWDDEQSLPDGRRLSARVDYFVSAFARLNVFTGDIRPYILLGGTYGRARASLDGETENENEGDVSYGAGVSFHIRDFAVQFEYINYLDKDDTKIQGGNLGVMYRF